MAPDDANTANATSRQLRELEERRRRAQQGGGYEQVQKIHASGRQTARERVQHLVDDGSWLELGMHAEPEHRRPEVTTTGDGIVTGLGRVSGRSVGIIAIDTTVLAGTTAPVNMRKQNRVAEWAARRGLPLICLSDNDGGRLPDLLGWRFSTVPFDFRTFLQPPPGCAAVPRLTAILGPSFGDAALHAAMGHFVVMTEDASAALSGPPVIKGALGEDVDAAELGGPAIAHDRSGTVHMVVPDEPAALRALRQFLDYVSDSAALPAPVAPPRPPDPAAGPLDEIVPESGRRGYDMRKLLRGIVDESSLLQWGERYGASLICGLARIEGEPVGIVASQPMQRAGVLDVPALRKEAEFIELCDTFNLPLVFFQDVPGLMIGRQAEADGILRAYEGVVTRLASATVPKIAVIVRKAYGGGHFAMGGRPVRPDLLVAWPSADLGFMAPRTGVRIVHRRRLEQARREQGDAAYETLLAAFEAEWAAESSPWEAAANVVLDDVIAPDETRDFLVRGIAYAWGGHARITRAGCP